MLLGDLVDTNTAWISQRLAGLGVGIYRHTTVGDNSERIVAALREAASSSDLVVTTGGLGPTSDDLTNACLSTLTGREMVEYPEAREHVDLMFTTFGRKPTANNYKQALFPRGTELIPNPVGTAMGALVECEGTLFATLPGVPSEMKSMFEATLEPLIRARGEGPGVPRRNRPHGRPTGGPGQGALAYHHQGRHREGGAGKDSAGRKGGDRAPQRLLLRRGRRDPARSGRTPAPGAGRHPGPRRELHRWPPRQAPYGCAGLFGILW